MQVLRRADHELYIFQRCTGAIEAGGGLDEVQVCGAREVRGSEDLLRGELRGFKNELDDDRRRAEGAYRCELAVDGAVVWDFLILAASGGSGVGRGVSCGDAINCRVVASNYARGFGPVVLGEKGVVEYEIQFGSTGGHAGASFTQLGVSVLRALVKTDDRCYNDCGALQVCDASLNPV